MKRPVTIKDIAEQLNISVSTVSRALKNNHEISASTRKKVQELAKELGYRPNPIAVALKTSKSYTIGVIVPKIVNTFFANVVETIESVADEYGYNVLVISSNEDYEKEKKSIEIFLANRTDGIILSLSRETTDFNHIKMVQQLGIPIVLFDRTTDELEISKVISNGEKAAYQTVEHLAKNGSRKIALLMGPTHLLRGNDILNGYKEAVKEFSLSNDKDLIIHCPELTENAGREATKVLLNSKEIPDAIIGINDDLALGAIEAIKEKNISIPDQISVVGFSNTKRSRYMSPTLSSIDQFPEKIGRKAAELLFEQILSEKKIPIKEEIINCQLLIRDSSNR